MTIQSEQIYHIYNQGNNQQTIFFQPENYYFFLRRFRKEVLPYCEVLAYCLMPNHFHFLVYTDEKSVIPIKIGSLTLTNLTNGFRLLQSSYAKAINEQEKRTGSLFRQKTKYKKLTSDSQQDAFTSFQYIHQNPLQANLVNKIEDWAYSSFPDYLQIRQGTLCNQTLAQNLIGFSEIDFYQETCQIVSPNKLKQIW